MILFEHWITQSTHDFDLLFIAQSKVTNPINQDFRNIERRVDWKAYITSLSESYESRLEL